MRQLFLWGFAEARAHDRVDKRSFLENDLHVQSILRGESKNPLFISAVGLPLPQAAAQIAQMEGTYRIPTLLKRVDSESRL